MDMPIGAAMGVPKGQCPPQFLENIVILCFERRFSKQNSVIRMRGVFLNKTVLFHILPRLDQVRN